MEPLQQQVKAGYPLKNSSSQTSPNQYYYREIKNKYPFAIAHPASYFYSFRPYPAEDSVAEQSKFGEKTHHNQQKP